MQTFNVEIAVYHTIAIEAKTAKKAAIKARDEYLWDDHIKEVRFLVNGDDVNPES